MHSINKLKNRTLIPQGPDFDNGVTLNALLQPGDDATRWSEAMAARVAGYVSPSETAVLSQLTVIRFSRETRTLQWASTRTLHRVSG